MGERVFFDKGHEHIVWKASSNHPDKLLKVPRFWHHLLLLTYGTFTRQAPANVIRSDLRFAQELTSNLEKVHLPNSKVKGMGKSYVIIQDLIKDDQSIANPLETLCARSQFLADKCELHPENFKSLDGEIYWVDPIKDIFTRVATDLRIVSWEKITRIRVKIRRFIHLGGGLR